MRPRVPTFRPGRERGWVGLVVILVALAIVAWLSKDALLEYGMLSGGTTAAKRSGSAAPAAEAAAAPTPSNVMEKAKSLEGMLQQESARRDGGN